MEKDNVKVGDMVIASDLNGVQFKGKIININEYRPPEVKYALDIDGFDDIVFVGDEQIIKIINKESK